MLGVGPQMGKLQRGPINKLKTISFKTKRPRYLRYCTCRFLGIDHLKMNRISQASPTAVTHIHMKDFFQACWSKNSQRSCYKDSPAPQTSWNDFIHFRKVACQDVFCRSSPRFATAPLDVDEETGRNYRGND